MFAIKLLVLAILVGLFVWLIREHKSSSAPAECVPEPRRSCPRASRRSTEKLERLETLAELHGALHKVMVPLVLGCAVLFGIGPYSPAFKLLVGAVPMYAIASGSLWFLAFFQRQGGKVACKINGAATLVFAVSIALWVVWAAAASGSLMLQAATHQPFAGSWCFMPWEPWILRVLESAKTLF